MKLATVISLSVLALLPVLGIVACGDRTVADKIQAQVDFVDADNDGMITVAEWQAYYSNLDENKDGCIARAELLSEWGQFGWTADYINSVFDGWYIRASTVQTGCGDGIVVSTNPASLVPKRAYLGMVTQVLIGFCEGSSNPELYLSNEDCRELPKVCALSDVGCNYGCFDYIINTAPSRYGLPPFDVALRDSGFFSSSFEEAFDHVWEGLDYNGDGQMSVGELTRYGREVEDYNYDGCVDLVEVQASFMFRRCGGNGLTKESAIARFNDLKIFFGGIDPACNGFRLGNDTSLPMVVMTQTQFAQDNLQSYMDMCEEDRSRYETNRDCNQMLKVCLYSKYKDNTSCKRYINRVIKGEAGFAF